MIDKALLDYYRCPEEFAKYAVSGELSKESGFFRFGPHAICYGQTALGYRAPQPGDDLYDVLQGTTVNDGTLHLPFHPCQVVEHLRRERYAQPPSGNRFVHKAYYAARPFLPTSLKVFLQKARLSGWDKLPFPRWPVDRTVESVFEGLVAVRLEAQATMPFIWFWPDGAASCLIMTHDVETQAGLDFCPTLMDMDDSFGIKASFQLVPEKRYVPSKALLDLIQGRGFEANVHDLNHDGRLYDDRQEFLRRAEKINCYVKEFGVAGFRAGAMYRNLDWYDAFEFSYDMSVPNVAHLEPQQGGCCTLMPYFIGRILELPLTTTQDYALFNFIGDYSIDLWKRQIRTITASHGLVSVNVHPDYIIGSREQEVYRALLAYLSELCSKHAAWMALPGEVNRWWRQRSQMRLVRHGDAWRIEGDGHERARVAFASLQDDRIVYHIAGMDR